MKTVPATEFVLTAGAPPLVVTDRSLARLTVEITLEAAITALLHELRALVDRGDRLEEAHLVVEGVALVARLAIVDAGRGLYAAKIVVALEDESGALVVAPAPAAGGGGAQA